MKEKLSVRLQELMDRKNLNQTELGKMTGITPSSISDYLNERYKPKQDKIDAIAKALQVDPAYLMGYEVDERGSAKNILPLPKTLIPLIGTIAAGEPVLAVENIEEYIDLAECTNADFCLRVTGDSMIGVGIRHGDVVFIRQQPEVEDGEIAAVLIDDEATLKKVYKFGEVVQLRAENPKYEPIVLNGDRHARILGKAVSKLTKI